MCTVYFAHGNLLLRATPQTQPVAWASGPPPEHQTADCVPAARAMCCWPVRPLARFAAASGRDPDLAWACNTAFTLHFFQTLGILQASLVF